MNKKKPPQVTYEASGGVAVLTLNRPRRLNALTPSMEVEYFDALERAAGDRAARVIVVTGAGRAFCAGADIAYLETIGETRQIEPTGGRNPTFALSIPKPIIAAVNGPCAGAGLILALMCDLRFAAVDAKLTTALARRALIAEHGLSWVLPRLVGPGRALDLMLSARIFRGEEALQLGLVERVYSSEQLLSKTLEYAGDLARNCSPAAMAVIKRQVYAHLEVDLATAVAESDDLMRTSVTTADFLEGVASFVERREPRFAPLVTSATSPSQPRRSARLP